MFKKKTKHSNKLTSSNLRNGIPLWMCAHLLVKAVREIKDKIFLTSHIQNMNQVRKVSKLVTKSKFYKVLTVCVERNRMQEGSLVERKKIKKHKH